MGFKYAIVLEFEAEEQVNLAYRSFTENLPVQDHLPVGNRRFTDDWRACELSIDTIKGMELPIDAQDKDLLLSQFLGHGIIRLFKLNDQDIETTSSNDLLTVPGDDTMVSILFVPTYFTVHDLLHFYIGDDIVNNQVSNFRILRNKKGELGFNFMVLIKFKESLQAKKFKDEFNGKRFSKMDPETCHVVSIKEVVFNKAVFEGKEPAKLPYLLTDPFTRRKEERQPMEVELPTCPVCLERMDSDTTGLITIPCQHTFHCECLEKWKNSRCPVCRYSSIRLSRNSALRHTGETSGCSACGCHENLWICLVCGNIGCGRYNSKHAIKHYEDTSHCFAMDMHTQRVWDYAGDNYVHRLVQNEVDGKLVEVEADRLASGGSNISSSQGGSSALDKDNNTAANFMRNKEYHLEYVQVLISQLESQREYFEMKLEQAHSTEHSSAEIEPLRREIDELKTSFKECRLSFQREREAARKQLDEDKLLITGLQENLDHLMEEKAKMLTEKEVLLQEKQDLQEQVQDLMFYLQSQEKFKDADESVKEGTIIIQDPHQNTQKKKATSSKKKKVKKTSK